MRPDSAWHRLRLAEREQLKARGLRGLAKLLLVEAMGLATVGVEASKARPKRRKEHKTSEIMRTPEARISGTAGKSVQAISAYFTLFHLISTKFLFFRGVKMPRSHEAGKPRNPHAGKRALQEGVWCDLRAEMFPQAAGSETRDMHHVLRGKDLEVCATQSELPVRVSNAQGAGSKGKVVPVRCHYDAQDALDKSESGQ